MKAVALASALLLAGCNGPGTEMSHGGRAAGENGCGGVQVTAGGGGSVGVMPQGAIGTVEVTPTGCKINIISWQYPPPGTPAPAAAPVAP